MLNHIIDVLVWIILVGRIEGEIDLTLDKTGYLVDL